MHVDLDLAKDASEHGRRRQSLDAGQRLAQRIVGDIQQFPVVAAIAGNDQVARARSDRWIIFLFFMMGLSIGVHLLNLLSPSEHATTTIL